MRLNPDPYDFSVCGGLGCPGIRLQHGSVHAGSLVQSALRITAGRETSNCNSASMEASDEARAKYGGGM